jgi:flagellar basal body-associated protein FliL
MEVDNGNSEGNNSRGNVNNVNNEKNKRIEKRVIIIIHTMFVHLASSLLLVLFSSNKKQSDEREIHVSLFKCSHFK